MKILFENGLECCFRESKNQKFSGGACPQTPLRGSRLTALDTIALETSHIKSLIHPWNQAWASLRLWRFVRAVQDTAWLSFHGILPTADRLVRFSMKVSPLCFCGEPETLLHMFTSCPFALDIVEWFKIQRRKHITSPHLQLPRYSLGSSRLLTFPSCLRPYWVFCATTSGWHAINSVLSTSHRMLRLPSRTRSRLFVSSCECTDAIVHPRCFRVTGW